MANLLSTNFSGGVFEKTLTAPQSTTNLTNSPYTGASEMEFDSTGNWDTRACRNVAFNPFKKGEFVVVWENAASTGILARIGQITGTTVTWTSSTTTVISVGSQNYSDPMIQFDQVVPNMFMLAYRYNSQSRWVLKNGKCDHGGLTFGDRWESNAQNNNTGIGIGDLAADPKVAGRFFVVGYDPNSSNQGYCMAIQVGNGGTNLGVPGVGSRYYYGSGSNDCYENKIAMDPHNIGKMIVIWSDANADDFGKARALTAGSSGTSVSALGSQHTFHSHGSSSGTYNLGIDFDPDTSTKFIITYRDMRVADALKAIVGTLNNSTGAMTYGAEQEFSSDGQTTNISFFPGQSTFPNKFIVTYKDASAIAKSRIGTYSGTTIAWDDEVTVNSSSTGAISPAIIDKHLKGRFLIAFDEGGAKVIAGKMNSNTITIDLTLGNVFTVDFGDGTILGPITNITVTGATGTNVVHTFILKIIQGSPSYQIDWDTLTAFKWQKYWLPGKAQGPQGHLSTDGTPEDPTFSKTTGWIHRPSISTINDTVDVYSFTTYNNGTTWYASIVGQDIS